MNELDIAQVARKTIPFMARKNVKMTPENYRLWFEYFRGDNKELREELDYLIESGTVFDEKTDKRLFEKYFERDFYKSEYGKLLGEFGVAKELTHNADSILNDIQSVLSRTSTDTAAYGKTLDRNIEISKDLSEPNKLTIILERLLAETKKMVDVNRKTIKELEKSSGEIRDLRSRLDRARSEARVDGLTGIHNRRAFEEKIVEEIERHRRAEKDYECCLSIMDVDNFKKLNDTYGHPVGDKALVQIAKSLKEHVRKADFVARIGGEEFAVIFPNTKIDAVVEVLNRFRQGLADTEFVIKDKTELITMSVGVSEFRKERSMKEIMDIADKAMYMAKRKGKNRVYSEFDLEKEGQL